MSAPTVTVNSASCGAAISGIDLRKSLSPEARASIVDALLRHRVVALPDQELDDDQLEAFSRALGPFGDDPFIAPIPGRKHIIAVCRKAGEKAPIFAENWHTDWSFQAEPPAATCLYGITIPPKGGNTEFANQIAAAAALPAALRNAVSGKLAVHSAKLPYAPNGVYGDADRATDRSMDIRADASAEATMLHPLLSAHPDTGEERLFGTAGYIIGIEGVPDDEALGLLMELAAHQTRPEFVYSHQWSAGTVLLWDNRSVLHRATGGYEGYDRLLHRTTIARLT